MRSLLHDGMCGNVVLIRVPFVSHHKADTQVALRWWRCWRWTARVVLHAAAAVPLRGTGHCCHWKCGCCGRCRCRCLASACPGTIGQYSTQCYCSNLPQAAAMSRFWGHFSTLFLFLQPAATPTPRDASARHGHMLLLPATQAATVLGQCCCVFLLLRLAGGVTVWVCGNVGV